MPLAALIELLAARSGADLDVVGLPADRLPIGIGATVERRLSAVVGQDPNFAALFVHRDAEAQDPDHRRREVALAVSAVSFTGPSVAVVPVRMTEAWLLLDEGAIRRAAGRPRGKDPLSLPTARQVERLADPKRRLQATLAAASGLRGRRLKVFKQQFGAQRRMLLECLDPDGPVSSLGAWQRFVGDVADVCRCLE